jgi:hypothetical protein
LAQNGDKFKSLQKINLNDNKITDAGLKELAQNEMLRKIVSI